MKLLIIVLFFSISCSHREVHETVIPANLIEKEKFSQILEELMLVESHIQSEIPQFDLTTKSMKKSSELIFKKYNVTASAYEASFEYYATDQQTIKSIYNLILERMAKNATKIQVPK